MKAWRWATPNTPTSATLLGAYFCFHDPSNVDFGIGINDALIDNDKFPFRVGFNPRHIYSIDFTGQGAAISLDFHDCVYRDHSGSLKKEIWRK